MATLLLAWEVGADYGHVMRLAGVARALAARGHAPVLVLRDLTFVHAAEAGGPPLRVLQAPVWSGAVSGLPPPVGPAETLLRMGFLHPQALEAQCRAWRELVALLQPAAMLFDHAPAALLATRGLPLQRVLFGDSFASPPRTEPLPAYRWWAPEPPARRVETERHALAGANAVLARLGQPPLARLADLYDADDELILTHAPFDQHAGRAADRPDAAPAFCGALPALDAGVAPAWPAVPGPRVFAYVKARSRDFAPLMAALRQSEVSAVVHAPGLSANDHKRLLAANVAIHREPLRMDRVCAEAQIGIGHGGANTTQALVTAGIPVLLLTEHLEQLMTARRVAAAGAGLYTDFEKPLPDLRRLLRRLIDEPVFAESARAVAAACDDGGPELRLARVIDRIEAAITRGGARGGARGGFQAEAGR